MALKNLMEDIVRNVVDEILKNDDTLRSEQGQIENIIAYVMNRIPPRYVTSERGILHGLLLNRLETQQKTDIFMLTYEAIEVFKKRRVTPSGEKGGADRSFRTFPHIIGQVLEESTFSVIAGVKVSLLYKGEPVAMVDPDWINPYVTNKGTKGYYHFWPDIDFRKNDECETYSFNLKFEHPSCHAQEIEIEIDCTATTGLGMSYAVPIVVMRAKDGINIETLIN